MEKVKYFYCVTVHSLQIHQYNTNYKPNKNLHKFKFHLQSIFNFIFLSVYLTPSK